MVVGGAAGTGGGDQEQAGRGACANRGGAPVDAVVDRARDRRGGRGGSGVVGPFGGGAGASRGRRERGDGGGGGGGGREGIREGGGGSVGGLGSFSFVRWDGTSPGCARAVDYRSTPG